MFILYLIIFSNCFLAVPSSIAFLETNTPSSNVLTLSVTYNMLAEFIKHNSILALSSLLSVTLFRMLVIILVG